MTHDQTVKCLYIFLPTRDPKKLSKKGFAVKGEQTTSGRKAITWQIPDPYLQATDHPQPLAPLQYLDMERAKLESL